MAASATVCAVNPDANRWRGAIPRDPRRDENMPSVRYPAMMTLPSTSSRSAASARVIPSTSIIHGTAHNPWIAMNDPMPTAASGAIHQKRRLAKISRTPRHCDANPGGCSGR